MTVIYGHRSIFSIIYSSWLQEHVLLSISKFIYFVSFTAEGCKCKKGEFLCKDGLKCVPYSKLCDCTMDCADNSDEEIMIMRLKNDGSGGFDMINICMEGELTDACP